MPKIRAALAVIRDVLLIIVLTGTIVFGAAALRGLHDAAKPVPADCIVPDPHDATRCVVAR